MRHPVRLVTVLLAVVGAMPPVLLYWAMVARVPTVTPEEAKEVLAHPGAAAALVDVRTPEEFAAEHLAAAHNWPYAEIASAAAAEAVPAELQGKRLMLICQSGILSSLATRHLRSLGLPDAANVQGGMQTWVASAEKPCILGLCQLRAESGEARDLPVRDSSLLEQWTAVVTGFMIKPLYTVVSLLLVVLLWRQTSPDLAALRWALVCFFVGENFCAANYIVYSEQSVAFEYLHSYGMVLCFGLATYALLEGMDQRLIKLSDPEPRCAALGLCRQCIKHADVPCGLQRVFTVLVPAVMIAALAPLCAELAPVSYNTTILGSFYNYSHHVVHQVFEARYLPAAAAVLLLVSLALLQLKRHDNVLWSKVYFAAGMGATGFSFLRVVLFHAFRDNLVWFGAWEEVTELVFILGIGAILWIFRDALLPELFPALAKAGSRTRQRAR
jgi:rhodanese-related sulfurtransferase